jgi:hypothetical protein
LFAALKILGGHGRATLAALATGLAGALALLALAAPAGGLAVAALTLVTTGGGRTVGSGLATCALTGLASLAILA